MVETVFAGITLAVCVVLLLRLLLGRRRQQRFDASVRHAWAACRRTALRAFRWRSSRREAAAAADDAIRRARSTVRREGNVIRPRKFRGPRKPHWQTVLVGLTSGVAVERERAHPTGCSTMVGLDEAGVRNNEVAAVENQVRDEAVHRSIRGA